MSLSAGSCGLLHGRTPRWSTLARFAAIVVATGVWTVAASPHAQARTLNELFQEYEQHRKAQRYADAERLGEQMVYICEASISRGEYDCVWTLVSMADIYGRQGKYRQAEELYQRAIPIQQRVFGRHHPDVAASLNGLARAHIGNGESSKAGILLRRALEIQDDSLRPGDPRVATTLSNIALLYYTEQRFARAEELYRRALTIQEKALGPYHREVAVSLNRLGDVYREQGKAAQAEDVYKRAKEIAQAATGPDRDYLVLYEVSLHGKNEVKSLYCAYTKSCTLASGDGEVNVSILAKPPVVELNKIAWSLHLSIAGGWGRCCFFGEESVVRVNNPKLPVRLSLTNGPVRRDIEIILNDPVGKLTVTFISE